MSRNLGLYLTDIICSIDKIQKYTSGMTYDVKDVYFMLNEFFSRT